MAAGGPMDELGGAPIFVVHVKRDDARVLVRPEGELDLNGTGRLLAAVRAAAESEEIEVVAVDLSGLRFVDSAGLQAVLDARQAVESAGLTFRLVAVSSAFRRVTELAGLEAVLRPVAPPASS
jgi:anti-anti-sigma factor